MWMLIGCNYSPAGSFAYSLASVVNFPAQPTFPLLPDRFKSTYFPYPLYRPDVNFCFGFFLRNGRLICILICIGQVSPNQINLIALQRPRDGQRHLLAIWILFIESAAGNFNSFETDIGHWNWKSIESEFRWMKAGGRADCHRMQMSRRRRRRVCKWGRNALTLTRF